MLLDTNVVSATRKPRRYPDIIAWVKAQAAGSLWLPGPVLAELSFGVHRVEEAVSRRMHEAWLQAIMGTYQIVPMDADAFFLYGQMLTKPALAHFRVTPPGAKRAQLAVDLQIAAIALTRNDVLATLNTRDFAEIKAQFPSLRFFSPSKDPDRL